MTITDTAPYTPCANPEDEARWQAAIRADHALLVAALREAVRLADLYASHVEAPPIGVKPGCTFAGLPASEIRKHGDRWSALIGEPRESDAVALGR